MNQKYGHLILRLTLGILFLGAGLMKLLIAKPAGVTQMLSGIGFPVAVFFAWLLLIVEILGGLTLIIGYKTHIAAWALSVVMLVAILTVQVKTFTQEFPAQMQFLKDLAIFGGLVSLGITSKSFNKEKQKTSK